MSRANPRILFLSPCWPLGNTFGGQLRALHTGRALAQLGDVTFAIVGSNAADREAARLTAEEFRVEEPIPSLPLPRRGIRDQLRWALDARYLNVHGVAAAPEARARLVKLFDRYDLIWVLNARTPNLLQVWRWPHTHLDLDDIPSTHAAQLAQTAPRVLERCKARVQRTLLHRRERQLHERFTTLSVCSQADRAYLGGPNVHVIPNGFARPAIEPASGARDRPPRIGFIGLYSYLPNAEGVRWFLRHVWPQVRRAVPGVRFRVVGRETDGPDRPVAPDTDVLGWLPDADDEVATWSAMIVPIRLGGGTRVKLSFAFSRKCPVVSTRYGAYGYEVEDGRELLLSDDPDGFARACIHLLQDAIAGQIMAERAWQAFLRNWTWDAIAPKVIAAAEDCLRRSSGDVRPPTLQSASVNV